MELDGGAANVEDVAVVEPEESRPVEESTVVQEEPELAEASFPAELVGLPMEPEQSFPNASAEPVPEPSPQFEPEAIVPQELETEAPVVVPTDLLSTGALSADAWGIPPDSATAKPPPQEQKEERAVVTGVHDDIHA